MLQCDTIVPLGSAISGATRRVGMVVFCWNPLWNTPSLHLATAGIGMFQPVGYQEPTYQDCPAATKDVMLTPQVIAKIVM